MEIINYAKLYPISFFSSSYNYDYNYDEMTLKVCDLQTSME